MALSLLEEEPRQLTSAESIAITESNQLTSPLLRLPAELRNKIYEYACIDTIIRSTNIMSFQPYRHKTPVSERKPLAIISTCKQMRHEASGTLYSHAAFDLVGLGLSAETLPCVHHRITSIVITESQLLKDSSAFLCELKCIRLISWRGGDDKPGLLVTRKLRKLHGKDLRIEREKFEFKDYMFLFCGKEADNVQ
ncbi:hypothetical protein PtrSN002B_003678 [Pyrenophora tritici-repentis]|uniref:2EXR domain-containing protein n=2 Tax=Pyrenophora tritici-repentis TaxID=45151 RepID=A0A2W1GCR4_9PLEO|nr:uncharacterized protein PTRG_03853 [Pyrenophora tritici-repentis Pt-1C-BFP]KAA8620089.1 hypothetical protein PtrV1_07183 [Pyrenophora tritici-repentis]EDU46691.1 predicted protein [Pyrenophora tritici-repentis Pt-1C-BFP]KAF7448240.1 hypothetical protein A1F99_076040 [Pyrenophora tritici-repentis]KAF7571954.1 hypothetical protein PtrM4_094540 [Pyrenophora tritici-repentis]KAG9384858.1 hypothetical protein A1F94_004405 [Pyrenophora tritici-repentis]